jgi:hypothetical protein
MYSQTQHIIFDITHYVIIIIIIIIISSLNKDINHKLDPQERVKNAKKHIFATIF